MEHLFPVIVFIIFAVMKVLKARGGGEGGKDEKTLEDSELERARRFREALGLPPNAQPPGPVRKRAPALSPGPMPPVQPPLVLNPGHLRRVRPQNEGPFVLTPPRLIPPVPLAPVSAPILPPPALPEPLPLPRAARLPVLPPVASAARQRGMAAIQRAYRQEPASGGSRVNARAQGIQKLLRAHGSARQAMIVREVLGPPKALS